MLLSIALILVVGMTLGWLCQKCKLPSLLGMLFTGVILGPYVFDCIDTSILSISSEIRKIALIIILTRAGLSLDISGLKKIGRPAVVVPRMVKLMEEGYGTKKGIPQLILAGASVDDVYVIVLFTTFVSIIQGNGVSAMQFVNIPVSIILGVFIGLGSGWMFSKYFERAHIRDTIKILLILSWSFILVTIEDSLNTPVTFSALIAIMFMGVGLQKYRREVSIRLAVKYNKLWVGAEVFLFVLVGAAVNINYLGNIGIKAIIVIAGALVFRMLGVLVCLLKSNLNIRERAFSMIAYTPKATVQAAIGGIPLSLGLQCGDVVLTIAVLAIVFSAPFGAFAMDVSYKKLLER